MPTPGPGCAGPSPDAGPRQQEYARHLCREEYQFHQHPLQKQSTNVIKRDKPSDRPAPSKLWVQFGVTSRVSKAPLQPLNPRSPVSSEGRSLAKGAQQDVDKPGTPRSRVGTVGAARPPPPRQPLVPRAAAPCAGMLLRA